MGPAFYLPPAGRDAPLAGCDPPLLESAEGLSRGKGPLLPRSIVLRREGRPQHTGERIREGTRGASVSLPLWHFLRPSVLMALAVHGAVGASGPAGGLPLLLLPDQAPDDQRYDDDQSHTNQNGAYILADPLQHGNSLLF